MSGVIARGVSRSTYAAGTFFLLLLAVPVSRAPAAQAQSFTVGIVRYDGALVPFAAYEAGKWERAWPEADEAVRATTLETVPSVWLRRGSRVPADWRVFPLAGGTSSQIQVAGIELVDAHCQKQIALKTNLPKTKADHHVKIGVALDSSSIPVGAIESVSRPDPMWAAAEKVVLAGFSKLEAAHQFPQVRETPEPSPQIKVLYRESKSPQSSIYFVAEKKYRTQRMPQDRECGAVTVTTGWLVRSASGALRLMDPKVFVTDCDRKEVIEARPLAVIRIGSQPFWVVEEHGYEGEEYAIAEIRETEVRYPVKVDGGGC